MISLSKKTDFTERQLQDITEVLVRTAGAGKVTEHVQAELKRIIETTARKRGVDRYRYALKCAWNVGKPYQPREDL